MVNESNYNLYNTIEKYSFHPRKTKVEYYELTWIFCCSSESECVVEKECQTSAKGAVDKLMWLKQRRRVWPRTQKIQNDIEAG